MNLFKNIEDLVFETPKWKFLLILFVILIFKTGIFYHPNLWRHLEVARSPFENFFENNPSLLLLSKLVWFFLAGKLGATNKGLFFFIPFILFFFICSCFS